MNRIGNNSYFNLQTTRYASGMDRRAAASVALTDNADQPANRTDKLNKQLNAFFKRAEETKQALAKLNVMSQDSGQAKKASAAERVRQIKEQLKMLMSMSMIGSPKANAQQIAQLAKELASAAGEYASACGGASQNASPTLNVTADSPEGSAAVMNVAANSSAAAVSPDTMVASAPCPESTDQSQTNQSPQDGGEAQNNTGESGTRTSGRDADADFVREVRSLAAQLKALAKQQEMRLHLAGDRSADNDLSKINQSISEIEKVTSGIVAAEGATSISVFA